MREEKKLSDFNVLLTASIVRMNDLPVARRFDSIKYFAAVT
jgi:hypothetical protein